MYQQFPVPANERRLREPLGCSGLPVHGSARPGLTLTPVCKGCQPGLPRDSAFRLTPAPAPRIHSQPVSVTGPGPWRWSPEKSAEGQLPGEAKWACCPSVAENVGRKIRCNHVQIITPRCTSLSISHLLFIICLSISGGPGDPRHTVGAQTGAKRGLPSPGS